MSHCCCVDNVAYIPVSLSLTHTHFPLVLVVSKSKTKTYLFGYCFGCSLCHLFSCDSYVVNVVNRRCEYHILNQQNNNYHNNLFFLN